MSPRKPIRYPPLAAHRSPGSAQHMLPTCKVCGGRYNKADYYGHAKTERHIRALRR
jgi:hypothetical protein